MSLADTYLLDPRRKHIAASILAEAERHQVPRIGEDQIEYLWSTDCDVDIVCHLDYSKEEPADHYGDFPHPGSLEQMTLCAAYVRGVDIFGLLSDKQISDIEERALLARSE